MSQPVYPGTMFTSLDVGGVISLTARVLGAKFGQLFAVTFVCLLPVVLLQLGMWFLVSNEALTEAAASAVQTPGGAAGVGAGAVVVLFAQLLLNYVAQGVVIYVTVEQLAGQPSGIGRAFAAVGPRLLWIILTAVVETLVVGLGTLLCIIPGIILSCMYYVAIPACVVEQTGPIQSLSRSSALTGGYKLTIFFIALVMGLIAGVIGLVEQLPAFVMAADPRTAQLVQTVLGAVISPIQTMFMAVAVAVVYVQLRGVRDGLDANAIADVFA